MVAKRRKRGYMQFYLEDLKEHAAFFVDAFKQVGFATESSREIPETGVIEFYGQCPEFDYHELGERAPIYTLEIEQDGENPPVCKGIKRKD